MSAPLVQPVQASVDLPLDDYGRALISYSGTGTVTWDDGSSNALTFNAAQFSDGRIVVLGHYANDNPFRWFGGGGQDGDKRMRLKALLDTPIHHDDTLDVQAVNDGQRLEMPCPERR